MGPARDPGPPRNSQATARPRAKAVDAYARAKPTKLIIRPAAVPSRR